MSQIAIYRKREKLFDIPYSFDESLTTWWYLIEDALPIDKVYIVELALKLFAIVPHAASCERIWSSLGHFYGKHRTRLKLEKIENMQKMTAYYIANAKTELPYYSISKSEEDIQNILKDADLFQEDNDLDEDIEENFTEPLNEFDGEDQLHLEDILNLDAPEITDDLDEIIMDSDTDIIGDEETMQEESEEENTWNPETAADIFSNKND